ncbi:MAG: flagellar filament capping protein FliD [Sulfuricurvum sp.]|nr:flagellar filament capping protein FliD [Sulfuricurvum sp.]
MAGISSLGVGSGVLTSDVIDKLRAGNEAQVIKPLDTKIETASLKLKSFDFLNTLMDTFQKSVSKLSSDTVFLGRSVSGSNDAVTVSASAGADVQSFSLSNVVTAKGDIWHSPIAATSKTTALVPAPVGANQLSIGIGTNTPILIDYSNTTTLEELAAAINNTAGTQVTASILQTGASSYELVVKSDGVGANQNITFGDSGTLLTTLGMDTIAAKMQPAGDASFDYNGIAITRPTNEITDLVNGVTVSLKQDQTTSSNISITQNKTEISTEMSLMVQSYNTLVSNIGDMTVYDKAAGKVGVFNGDNYIKSITRELNRVMTSVDSSGKSLVDYGIDIDRNGVMSFDSATFDAKMTQDPTSLQKFFSGSYANGVDTPGIFDTLYDKMKSYTSSNKSLDTYQANLNKTLDKLNKDRATMTAKLDTRYEIMTKQFSAYDAIISKINSQFSSLKQMIDAQAAANK